MQNSRGFVLVHDEMGIYIGSGLGMGFWSKLDPVGQPCAVTFPSPEAAMEFAATWDSQLQNLKTVEVDIDDGDHYATRESCKRAGLETWTLDTDDVSAPAKAAEEEEEPEEIVSFEQAHATMDNIARVHCLDSDWNTMMKFIDQCQQTSNQYNALLESKIGELNDTFFAELVSLRQAVHMQVRDALKAMPDYQRLEIFNLFCKHCGSDDPKCSCWNDE